MYSGEAIFTVESPSAGQRVAAMLVPLLKLAIAVVALAAVRRLARAGRAGEPFVRQSRVAIRTLGLGLFCYGLSCPLFAS